MSWIEENAERMYPDSDITYGVDAVREAYAYGANEALKRLAQTVVTSVEELDKLPVGSLIMMRGVVAPFLHTDDGWESTRTPVKPVWDYTTNPSYLPARVLYRPTEETPDGR